MHHQTSPRVLLNLDWTQWQDITWYLVLSVIPVIPSTGLSSIVCSVRDNRGTAF